VSVARRPLGVLAGIIFCALPLAAQSSGANRGRVFAYPSTAVTVNAQVASTATSDLRLAPQSAVLTERTTALRRLPVSVPVDCPSHH
jgi:hypothetical protein